MEATAVMVTDLSASAAPATNDDAVGCANCSRGISADDAFCRYCGAEVDVLLAQPCVPAALNSPANAPPTQREAKSDTPDLAALTTFWVPNDFSNACMGCKVPFSFFKSRHHCRACGLLFCRECVKYKMVIPASFGYTAAQRCCIGCVTALQLRTITSPADVYAQRRGHQKKAPDAKGNQ